MPSPLPNSEAESESGDDSDSTGQTTTTTTRQRHENNRANMRAHVEVLTRQAASIAALAAMLAHTPGVNEDTLMDAGATLEYVSLQLRLCRILATPRHEWDITMFAWVRLLLDSRVQDAVRHAAFVDWTTTPQSRPGLLSDLWPTMAMDTNARTSEMELESPDCTSLYSSGCTGNFDEKQMPVDVGPGAATALPLMSMDWMDWEPDQIFDDEFETLCRLAATASSSSGGK